MDTNTLNNTYTGTAKPPVAKLRLGLINASIWERVTENGKFYVVTFERRYRDDQRKWNSTHRYDGRDLLTLGRSSSSEGVMRPASSSVSMCVKSFGLNELNFI
jgi:hypothetical protein